MTRRMLISGGSDEELRVAILDDGSLEEYQFEVAESGLIRGNVYRGRIARLEQSLNAAFIEYGVGRDGFLMSKDVVAEARYREPDNRRPNIDEILEAGQPIVVQVTRDAEGTKGAVLTTNLSLPGRYLVLTPFASSRGISRKVENDRERAALRDVAESLDLPKGCGVVVRTNARDQTRTELKRDLAGLLKLWDRVKDEAQRGHGVSLLYSDQDLLLKAFRDYLDSSIDEILVDDDEVMEKAERFLKAFLPRSKATVTKDQDRVPLFSRFGIEEQIERIYRRNVPLESGGSIVIDGTEALTAIDVNSGSATQAASQEEMALALNLEAAGEISRQLRLRDIGGLIVVDYIDMDKPQNRRKVEKEQKDGLKIDKARTRVSKISANGLLEINRQRVRQPLAARRFETCPTCRGRGQVPSAELATLQLVRRIEARAAGGMMKSVVVRLAPQMADAFQSIRRREIERMRAEYGIVIEVQAAPALERLDEDLQWKSHSKEDQAAIRAALGPVEPPPVLAPDAASVPVGVAVGEGRDAEEAKPKRKRRRRRGGARRRRPAKPKTEE
ncbi:MAG: Rne/Rng family ribonuclease [Acidobacteriota bacterium]|nr:Rne/Rng family ribonuclease [Acidobacteriota bacterium]